MKIKKIEKICKDGAQILRVDVPSETEKGLRNVFLGTEQAQFELSGQFWDFPPESFFDIFGISEKAQKNGGRNGKQRKERTLFFMTTFIPGNRLHIFRSLFFLTEG